MTLVLLCTSSFIGDYSGSNSESLQGSEAEDHREDREGKEAAKRKSGRQKRIQKMSRSRNLGERGFGGSLGRMPMRNEWTKELGHVASGALTLQGCVWMGERTQEVF